MRGYRVQTININGRTTGISYGPTNSVSLGPVKQKIVWCNYQRGVALGANGWAPTDSGNTNPSHGRLPGFNSN